MMPNNISLLDIDLTIKKHISLLENLVDHKFHVSLLMHKLGNLNLIFTHK